MLQVKRHSLIVEYVVEKGCARVNELSRLFGVSPETIRRDLTALARNKKIVRSFGGAMISENTASFLAADMPANNGNFVDKPLLSARKNSQNVRCASPKVRCNLFMSMSASLWIIAAPAGF